jgi:hypothetical protein
VRTLSAPEWLAVWEEGLNQSPVQRALIILAAACPETPPENLAKLSIGQRDERLLTLREWTFGPHLVCLVVCPKCSERLEPAFKVADIRVKTGMQGMQEMQGMHTQGTHTQGMHTQGTHTQGMHTQGMHTDDRLSPQDSDLNILSFETSEYEVHFRLPDSIDLLAAAGIQETESIHRLLLRRCLLSARRRGVDKRTGELRAGELTIEELTTGELTIKEPMIEELQSEELTVEELTVEELPAEVVQAVLDHMLASDPQADVQLALACPSCGHGWQVTFDIVSFFWNELDTWAHRTMQEVHILASAYGWRETDILAMNPWRRQCYLEMVNNR